MDLDDLKLEIQKIVDRGRTGQRPEAESISGLLQKERRNTDQFYFRSMLQQFLREERIERRRVEEQERIYLSSKKSYISPVSRQINGRVTRTPIYERSVEMAQHKASLLESRR
jgi:hypothetical protein